MKVCVVTPTYGRLNLLGRCVASFLSQTYEDSEMVIVNDDKDVKVWCDNPRVHTINLDTKINLPDKRNLGVGFGKYDLYMPLDDDDIFLKSRIENKVKIYQGNKDIQSTNDCNGYTVYQGKFRPLKNLSGTFCSYRRDAFYRVNGYCHPKNCGEDWEFTNKLKAQTTHMQTHHRDAVYVWDGVSVHATFADEDQTKKDAEKNRSHTPLKSGKFEIVPDFEMFNVFDKLEREYIEKNQAISIKL